MEFEILKYPDKRLLIPSKEVKDFDQSLKELSESLIRIVYSNPGCVGIAAPQVGINKRLIIVDVSKSNHRLKTTCNGTLTLVNPEIIKSEGEIVLREGCLSVPEFTGNVKRFFKIQVIAKDINGKDIELETEGFEAVVIQHEIDHLNGKVFLDRLISPKELFRRKNIHGKV
ncbi:MAG: peptide deformylase [Aquificaceae bacterium]